MIDYENMTDDELVEAAGRLLGIYELEDFEDFYPANDLNDCEIFTEWFLNRQLLLKTPINYRIEVIYRQDPDAPTDVHPVPQCILYRAIYEREHVIAPGAAVYECVNKSQARAVLVATLKAANGAG